MNKQWNTALEQVDDEHLLDAITYRKRLPIFRIAAGVAAVLAVVLVCLPKKQPDGTTGGPPPNHDSPLDIGNKVTAADTPADVPPGAGSLYGSLGIPNHGAAGSCEEEPPVSETLHFASYEQLQESGLDGVLIPCLGDHPTGLSGDITYHPQELYGLPWVCYPTEEATIQVAANLTTEATFYSDFLMQFAPQAPNLHNRSIYPEYRSIEEIPVTTGDGTKTALLYQTETRSYLHFLQDGVPVVISSSANAQWQWLEDFHLMPITDL